MTKSKERAPGAQGRPEYNKNERHESATKGGSEARRLQRRLGGGMRRLQRRLGDGLASASGSMVLAPPVAAGNRAIVSPSVRAPPPARRRPARAAATSAQRRTRTPRPPCAPALTRARARGTAGHRRAPPMAAEFGNLGDRQASYTRWWVNACPFPEECSSGSWARLKGSFFPIGGGGAQQGFERLGLRQDLVYPTLFFEPEPKAARAGSAPSSAA